ncbi:hypothetical protein AYO20_03825 [Fonsecaea nubica]|uniref:PRISE-like Rossmann-fold domain-containing protein n=1 Tax=Fonsecaea nubica TaxID=856822 RepID=A0A178D3K4_9EURO|nr:hypothetical protein AYO20_03825 [Fonsecaea nubica]OAL36770.1 hypothetical protein AYO20_03825 [Fonsecaea nubica]
MTYPQGKRALVFGASGITGWAVVNEILHDYPAKGVFDKVVALTNRPLSLEVSQWPADKRLEIVSGIDILKGTQEDLEATIKSNIPDIDTVTHVYYYAFKPQPDVQAELKDAVAMLTRTTIALDRLAPKLEFINLQTGTKQYGYYLRQDHYFPVPLKENLPRLKKPFADDIFYYPQVDFLTEFSKDKKWTWNETRPDMIIGFVCNLSNHSLAEIMGVYLSLWVKVYGRDSEVPFPGNPGSWVAKHNEAGADMIARQNIFTSLHPSTCGHGEAFNTGSNPQWHTWEQKWPQIAAYFGLKGTPPVSETPKHRPRDFIDEHFDEWLALEKEHGLRPGVAKSEVRQPVFELGQLEWTDFDRQVDMTKLQQVGFTESAEVMEIWGTCFDRMRKAKQIP